MCKSPSNNLPSDMCRIIGTFLNGDGDTCRRRRRCQATLRHQQRNINIARAAQTKLHAPLSVHCIGILQEIGEFNFTPPSLRCTLENDGGAHPANRKSASVPNGIPKNSTQLGAGKCFDVFTSVLTNEHASLWNYVLMGLSQNSFIRPI